MILVNDALQDLLRLRRASNLLTYMPITSANISFILGKGLSYYC